MGCSSGNHWFKIINGVLKCKLCGALPDPKNAPNIKPVK
jgi:hypothetical protein